uniref:Aminotransferase-like plant mobile domain-containing protein n=1 Tax=Fagus sylvatica TaxID=28930 RepID=A0A2N9EVS4_FAGSY
MEPSLIDDGVSTRQVAHRSDNIWKTHDSTPLTCRRREATLARSGLNNPRIVSYLRRVGFYGLSRLPFIKLDWHLITALVERWRPETHTFHLPSGEMTITLEDVSIQLGLPVDGLPVTRLTDLKWRELCIRLLGVDPPSPQLSGSRLSLNWLAQQFPPLATDADDVTVERYARMYILQLMGGSIFADKSQDKVHLMFLTLLEDFDVAGKYSWGGATLAWFLPHCATEVDYGGILSLSLTFRDNLYREVVWQPYSDEVIADLLEYCTVGKEIWRTVAPLICFHIVEKHYPDRNRREHIASADPQVGLMDENDEYMKWYRRITRRFISPMGALIDAMTSSLARIRELAEPESEIFTIACAALALDSSTSTTTTPQPVAAPSTSTTPTPEPFVTHPLLPMLPLPLVPPLPPSPLLPHPLVPPLPLSLL